MSEFADPPGASAGVARTLSALVDQYGPMLFNDPPRLKLLLIQLHPEAEVTIGAILAALTAEVPQRLMATHDEAGIAALLPRLADRVAQRDGVPHHAAVEAVRAWALALALPVEDSAGSAARGATGPAIDFASIVTPLAPRRAAPVSPAATFVEPPPTAEADPGPETFADTVLATQFMPAAAPSPTTASTGGPTAAPTAAPTRFVPAVPAAPPAPIVSTSDAATPRARTRGRAIAVVSLAVLALVAFFAWSWSQTPSIKIPPREAFVTATPVATPGPAEPPIAPATSAAEVVSPPAESRAVSSKPAPTAIPSPTTPLAIARVDVPRVVADQAFVVRLFVTGPVEQLAAVEERYPDGRSGRIASRTVPASALKATDGGALAVPVRGLGAGERSTIDFALVERSGTRSASKRAVFDVASATSAAEVAAGSSVACAPTTCGVVVESEEVGGGASTYRIVVENDARERATFSAPYRLQSGTRVRLAAGRVLPLVAAP